MEKPLVSIICLCFNHEKYIEEAINSVKKQEYPNIELIVVDDASNDESKAIISKLSDRYDFKTIFNESNVGNCRSFNKAFRMSSGKYLIDLAADDILMPQRVTEGVKTLELLGEEYGVHFSDVELVDQEGKFIRTHFARDNYGKLKDPVRQGDLYEILLEKYYISTPSMMMSRNVLEKLGGYDENLSYEDFDFWVRSSREFKYAFTDDILIKKRILSDSLSGEQWKHKNIHLMSTALVCEKALKLNKNKSEDNALASRVAYELRTSLITENWEAAEKFIDILKRLNKNLFFRCLAQSILFIRPGWFFLWKRFSKKF